MTRQRIAGILFALAMLPMPTLAGGRAVVPLAWQKKLQNSPWDVNHNQVDDSLEALNPSTTTDLIVDLTGCLDTASRARLSTFGTIDYEAVNFPILHMTGVPVSLLVSLAQDPLVAFLEQDLEVFHTLDISNPAIQVKSSPGPGGYSPNTVIDKYGVLGGNHAAIAIVDSGIDDQLGPNVNPTHQSLPRFSGGLSCPFFFNQPCVDVNPDDLTGTGTFVAAVALGAGDGSGVDAAHLGIASQAGLYDVQVIPNPILLQFFTSRIIRSLDTIASRMGNVQWQLQTVLIPWTDCRDSDGSNALSVAVSALANSGLLVITGMGNCQTCLAACGGSCSQPCRLVPSPAAADGALVVGASDDHNTISRADDTVSSDSLRGPRLSDNDGDTKDEQKPDIVAPGVEIVSALYNTADQYVSNVLAPPPLDARLRGTSLAAAHAAGCAALVTDVANLHQFDVRQLFIDTADNKSGAAWDPASGAGILNCFAAVDFVNDFLCTNVTFDGVCGAPPLTHCGIHPALHAKYWPAEGVANEVIVDLRNDGPGFTGKFRVQLRVDTFSNGDDSDKFCTLEVGPLAPGEIVHPTCPWTPKLKNPSPGSVVHGCLYADIIYPDDCSFADNTIQHNEEIQRAFSPAVAAMDVENTLNEAVTVELYSYLDCQGGSCSGWSFSPSANFISMAPDECPATVLLSANPSSSAVRQAQAHVIALGHTQGGNVYDMGSVTLTAQLACPTRTLRFTSNTDLTWLPPLGPSACLNGLYDVARGPLPIRKYDSTTLRGDYLGGTCIADDVSGTAFTDPTVPPVGTGFYYVTRSGGPIPGSWDIVDALQKGHADDTLRACP